jgi:hypothetical protein
MAKQKLTPAYWHEACDRTFCVQQIIDNLLSQHPAISQTPHLKIKIEQLQEILSEIYQETGAKM